MARLVARFGLPSMAFDVAVEGVEVDVVDPCRT
jgi:hypothetical protein